ncbi:MAG: TolC family protein [Dehalococcoidia bacterium]
MSPAARGSVVVAVVLMVGIGTTTLTAQPQSLSQPLTLAAAIEYAAAHYPTVQAALERVAASAADVDVARAQYLPRLDGVWQVNRATVNNVTGLLFPQAVVPSISGPPFAATSGQSVWGSAMGALLSWEPIDLGQRRAAVREAEAAVVRARAGQSLTRLEVQHAVGLAYLAVVAAERGLGAADADVERRGVLARTTRALVDAQLRPGADRSRADAEFAAATTAAVRARLRLEIARAGLARLLGVESLPALDATRVLAAVPPAPAAAPPAVHPLATVRQAVVDEARARDAVLSTSWRPRVYLQSSVFARGTGAGEDGRLDGGAEGLGVERANWAMGFQIVLPNLFDAAAVRARRAAAGATIRAEIARYDDGVREIAAARRVAAAALAAAKDIAAQTPVQLEAARLSESQARARYDAGLAPLTEVADAQHLLAAADAQHAEAVIDAWRALLAQAAADGDLAPLLALLRSTP